MDIRKVQVTGGSSYVITLPKDWAEAQQVKKNDPLGLIAQPRRDPADNTGYHGRSVPAGEEV